MPEPISAYTAIISKVKVRPHPNADKLQLGTVLGNQVVVGLDTKDGELGIFFPTDGQLSHEFCVGNGLYTKSARDRLQLPPSDSVGFFDHNRRVRAQKFRGERSDGFFMPLNSLLWTGVDPVKLKEGDTLVEWGGYGICQKYYTPATLRAIGAKSLKRRDAKCFPKHDDTKQFRFVAEDIPQDSIIWITEKLHGTSGRYGLVWDQLPQVWWEKLLRFQPKSGWVYLNGSKNVILEKADSRNSFYGTDEFRYNVVKGLTLHKGEVLYFEIVGWVFDTVPIMPPHDTTQTKLEEIQSKYGERIHYTYGCPPGTHRMYVYKIVQVNEDGVARELPWTQVVKRCGELGVAYVPILGGPIIHDGDVGRLREIVERFTEGASILDHSQIREGIVVRAESVQGIAYVKNKSHSFGVMEGYIKEDPTFVDPEDIA